MSESEQARTEQVRISIRLSPQAKDALDQIRELGRMETIQEAVRRAISDELFLLKERRDGWRVLLEKNGQFREVRWTDL